MLKRFKILMIIIILSLIGIVTVVSIWLYDSYTNHLEIVTHDVERSLTSSVQRYYENNESTIQHDQQQHYRSFVESEFINRLIAKYPNIDSLEVQKLIAEFWKEHYSHFHGHKSKSDSGRYMLPLFVLQQITFTDQTLVAIDSLLHQSLLDKGIAIQTQVVLEQRKEHFRGPRKIRQDTNGMYMTRPLLVNPVNRDYLIAKFCAPILFILYQMLWQITIAVLMILGVVGAFIYLLFTINRQNRLAILRKSFVNNMTHELKTPVATVVAAVEAVQRFGAKNDQEKMNRYLQISQKELHHLAGLIDKVLQLNVDEVNGIGIDRSTVNLVTLLQDLIEITRFSAVKAVDFQLVYDVNDTYLLSGDLSLLRNVFSNLFDNSIKYSGGLTATIEIELLKEDSRIRILIRDHGIGISSSYHKEIFDMFFRVPHGDLHPVKGSGLGLAYVKQVVEQHGGQVTLKSEEGRGATFTIILPTDL